MEGRTLKRWALRLLLALTPWVALEIALRLAGIGEGIVYEEHPAYGYRPAPGQKFRTLGHPVTILPTGYRGPVVSSRTLVVGDSVVYGTAVLRDEETIPALLGAVNGGVNGWGPQNIAAYLREADLSAFRRVVWILPTCDILRPFMSLRSGLISTNRRMALRLEYLFRFLWYGKLRPQPSPRDPREFERNVAAVLEASQALRGQHISLLLALLPSREEALGETVPETAFLEPLLSRLQAGGVRTHLLRPTGPIARLYRDTAHLTAEGCRWVAQELRPLLEKETAETGS